MILLLLAVFSFVMYLATLIAPGTSKRFAAWVSPRLINMEHYADRAPGVFGWLLRGPFWASRKSLQKSKDLGEKTRAKLQ